MNSKQLTVFHEVMRSGSFSEASRNLNRTQPAVSAMIANLEQELGYKLFIRHAGQLLPVPEAHYLYEESREILERMRQVEQNMKQVGHLEQGQLRIVAMPGPSVVLLPQLLARFSTSRPGIRVALLTRSSAQVRHLIATQQFDIGLSDWDEGQESEAKLIGHDILSFDCLCALPANDALAQLDAITPTDLARRDLAALSPGHSTHKRASQAFAAHGIAFQPRFETQYFFPLLAFVEAGLACAIVDPLTAESYRRSKGTEGLIVFKRFLPAIPFSIAILKPQHRPVARLSLAFIEALRTDLTSLMPNG